MNIISFIASVAKPGGLWSPMINWFHNGIGNFGWTVLLVTVLIKLITSPLDFWVKLNTKKQTLIQQKCSPQVAKINKKFGKDAQSARIQVNELYKREGLNMTTGCLITLVNMILSITIFFTFYGSLRSNSSYQAISQYETLAHLYIDKTQEFLIDKDKNDEIPNFDITDINSADKFIGEYNVAIKIQTLKNDIKTLETEIVNSSSDSEKTKKQSEINAKETEISNLISENNPTIKIQKLRNDISILEAEIASETSEDVKAKKQEEIDAKNAEIEQITLENSPNLVKDVAYFEKFYTDYQDITSQAVAYASDAIVDCWKDIKSSWLWVENIWVADAPIYPFPTYNNLVSIAKNGGYSNYVKENINETDYATISNIINENSGRSKNGFFILAVLAALVTFASQYILELNNRLKNKNARALAKQSSDASMEMTTKIMKIIMPIMMVIFVLQSSASFGIYILASNISSIVFGQISNLIINKLTAKKQKEVEEILEKQAKKLMKKGKLQETN